MTQSRQKKRRVFGFFDHESKEGTAPPEVLDQLDQEELYNQFQWSLSQLKSSAITNLSLANVKVKLHRPKKKLKHLLPQQEFAQRA